MQIETLSPKDELLAIRADTARIAEIREEMEADFADSPDGSRTLSASENSEEDDYDPEAMYDRRGRIVREDPDADYDAECKYAEVD